jgi:hypothetical protein
LWHAVPPPPSGDLSPLAAPSISVTLLAFPFRILVMTFPYPFLALALALGLGPWCHRIDGPTFGSCNRVRNDLHHLCVPDWHQELGRCGVVLDVASPIVRNYEAMLVSRHQGCLEYLDRSVETSKYVFDAGRCRGKYPQNYCDFSDLDFTKRMTCRSHIPMLDFAAEIR